MVHYHQQYSKKEKKNLKNVLSTIFIRNWAHVSWPQHSRSHHYGSGLGKASPRHPSLMPLLLLLKKTADLQWSKKQWVSVLNLKGLEKQSYPKTIITESLPRERQGFARRGSSNLRPRPWHLHQTSWQRKGTRWGVQVRPLAVQWQIHSHPHIITPCYCAAIRAVTRWEEGFFTESFIQV